MGKDAAAQIPLLKSGPKALRESNARCGSSGAAGTVLSLQDLPSSLKATAEQRRSRTSKVLWLYFCQASRETQRGKRWGSCDAPHPFWEKPPATLPAETPHSLGIILGNVKKPVLGLDKEWGRHEALGKKQDCVSKNGL